MSRPTISIVDHFLDESAWTSLWTHFQFMELHPVSRTVGAWKLSDGQALGGHEILTPTRDEELVHDPDQPYRYPTESPIDAVLTALLSDPETYEGVVGDDWSRLSARAYVYPGGSALSWHKDDHELYAGAFIYYAHPVWNAHWGGELLVAEESEDSDDSEDLPIMGYRFETESYSEQLMESGVGRFVMPKPNRLVILGGAPHAIAPVTHAAGQNVRASVSGFFLRGT